MTASSWLSKAQVCALTGWTSRWVEKRAASGELSSRATSQRTRNGRTHREYLLDSLPAEFRARALPAPLALVPAAPAPLLDAAAKQPLRVALTPAAERKAAERLAILQPLIDFVDDATCRARLSQLRLNDGRAVTTAELMAVYLAEQHGVSAPTLWRWKGQYTRGGFHALAPEIRSDKGSSRWFKRFPAAAQVVASAYLKPFQTAATAYESLVRSRDLLGLTESDLPSYETVRRYLESLPKPAVVLAREGERAHNERMAMYLTRGYEDLRPNQIWVSDHMIHDVEVRNDCFTGLPQNAPLRLRLTCLIDMRSRKVVGFSWTPEGSSRSITTALRGAVERFGAPDIFYCDNGKDFQKVANGAEMVTSGTSEAWFREDLAALDRSGVLRRLGVQVQFCQKYHPQSKHIERFFRTLHGQFDSKFPHYTTGNAYQRPDQTVVAGAVHRKLLHMGRGGESPLVPASHFIRMARVWIEEIYNATHRHTGKGMRGMTPDGVYDAGYPVANRPKADAAILDQLLFERERRRVRESAVTLAGRRYMAADPHSSVALYSANETEVLICFDPCDLSRAVVTDLDGRKLADVEQEVLVEHGPAAAPAIAASMGERRRLRNASAQSIRALHSRVAMMGHKSELEILHERALLPAAVGDYTTQRPAPRTVTRTTVSAPQYAHDIAAEFLAEEA